MLILEMLWKVIVIATLGLVRMERFAFPVRSSCISDNGYRWMDDLGFTSFSTVFPSYQDRMIMKGCVQCTMYTFPH